MTALLLSTWLAVCVVVPTTAIPWAATPVSALSPGGLHHAEALRIRRDFGQPDFEIALDVWGEGAARPERITDVRLWWARPSRSGERNPFGARVRRHIEIDFEPNGPGSWTVSFAGDRKQFDFTVELDARGHAGAYADIVTRDGERVRHCRATNGTLEARRFLGIPVGIRQLRLSCVDAQGVEHDGWLPYRPARRRPA